MATINTMSLPYTVVSQQAWKLNKLASCLICELSFWQITLHQHRIFFRFICLCGKSVEVNNRKAEALLNMLVVEPERIQTQIEVLHT